ncbi:MAG: nitroreductase family protein [Thermodesulfobacteriota bacterium]
MKRRSVWIFKDREIHESIVEQLLDVANNAPSGGNIQPLSIIFVRSIEGMEKNAGFEIFSIKMAGDPMSSA